MHLRFKNEKSQCEISIYEINYVILQRLNKDVENYKTLDNKWQRKTKRELQRVMLSTSLKRYSSDSRNPSS